MLDTFKARLKAKTTATGVNLSKERITAIADRLHKKFPELTEEADHDARLDEYDEIVSFKDIAKDDDRIRTLERNTPPKTDPPKSDPPKADPAPSDDMPAWAKTLLDQNKALSEKIQGFEREKTAGSIKQQLAAKLKDIPANYYENWQLPENEDQLEAFAEKVNTGYTAFTQQLTEKGLIAPGIPASGTPALSMASKKIDPAIAGFVKAKQAVAQQTK